MEKLSLVSVTASAHNIPTFSPTKILTSFTRFGRKLIENLIQGFELLEERIKQHASEPQVAQTSWTCTAGPKILQLRGKVGTGP